MLIEIPDYLARKVRAMIKGDAAHHRRWAERWERDGQLYNAVHSWVSAALLEADLPEPIQVGHLARLDDESTEVLVIGIDGHTAWIRNDEGWRKQVETRDLTYVGPKPEGWGE